MIENILMAMGAALCVLAAIAIGVPTQPLEKSNSDNEPSIHPCDLDELRDRLRGKPIDLDQMARDFDKLEGGL